MISTVSFFFGITFLYAGFLASGRGISATLAFCGIGLILIVKPILDALRYFGFNLPGGPSRNSAQKIRKAKPKKVHLKIIKSEDDKPTIH